MIQSLLGNSWTVPIVATAYTFLIGLALGYLLWGRAKWKFQAQRDRAVIVATESLRLAAGLLEHLSIPGPVRKDVQGIMDEMQDTIRVIRGCGR